MVEITIDGEKVQVPEGSMVMHAADKLGTYIPHFCYHKKLSIAANCRMCLVDIEKAPKPMPACATPVTNGMVVHTKSAKALDAQQGVMEFLLINHPLDCPICDQGGECQLQDLAVGYGASQSRYGEEKRVVFHKDVGPLIAMEEMTRCIHCTRCVRFGQEVGGLMELGMTERGEHAEITTFLGGSVDSELSGNMIDLCPVGALTSKPFRYSARTWELSRRKSISPHDSTGSNLIVQVKANRVMRVLPLENEAVNECWLADRDRFSYEALNSEDRLTQPMLREGGTWKQVDWTTALDRVAQELRRLEAQRGAERIGALASPHRSVEELHLLAKLLRGLGSDNIDHRLRHGDFSNLDAGHARWLGLPIEALSRLECALVVGSFLRKDHPLFAQRLRQAARRGASLHAIHAVHDDWAMPLASRLTAAPSRWPHALAGVAAVIAKANGVPAPLEGGDVDAAAETIARSLLAGERKAVLLGNACAQHPEAGLLLAIAQWIGEQSGASVGYLCEAANSVGAQLVGALPVNGGLDAGRMTSAPLAACLLLDVEPILDLANPAAAAAALAETEFVVAMASFRNAAVECAHVLLPIAPFSETSGTFVNAEGRVQSFHAVVKPLGEARPAWKVLRVLGNLLGLAGFAHETPEEVRAEALGDLETIASRLSNRSHAPLALRATGAGLERATEVPIYATDPLVRRAPSLQLTADAMPPFVGVPEALWKRLGLRPGQRVRVAQGRAEAALPARLEPGLPENVLRVPTGYADTGTLGAMFGAIEIGSA